MSVRIMSFSRTYSSYGNPMSVRLYSLQTHIREVHDCFQDYQDWRFVTVFRTVFRIVYQSIWPMCALSHQRQRYTKIKKFHREHEKKCRWHKLQICSGWRRLEKISIRDDFAEYLLDTAIFFSMPSDILGGLHGDFTCGATSMCLLDIADVQNKAIICIRCDSGSIGGYGCDLATKQCVCGLKTLESSTCVKNDDCWKAGAVCTTYANFYSFSFGTQPCMESVGSSYCKKESPNIGTGTCVTYKNDGFELIMWMSCMCVWM